MGWKQGSKGSRGIPGKRPGAASRMNMIGLGMSWDSQAEQGRQRGTLWGGSRDQGQHRRGQNLPSAKNGSRRGFFSW